MVYAAWTFWLLVVVLAAWGVRELLTGLIKPRVLNAVLLPGTLVGVAGHALGLLVTGATIRDTTLIKDDDSGEPGTTADPQPRIPVVGPIIIGMLPLIACAAAIHFAAAYLGRPILGTIRTNIVGPTLPTSLAALWQLLRDLVTLLESFIAAIRASDLTNWKTLLFLYLTTCLTVRMAPFPGTARGTLGAILFLGILAGLLTWLFDLEQSAGAKVWPIVNLAVATLLALLLIALLIRGAALLVQIIRSER